MTIVNRWRFSDPLTLETYEFEINPKEGGSPQYKKHINYQNTSAPNGKTLVFEGRDEPQVMTFTGTILTQTQYDAMVTWFNKRHQIQITDDLQRTFTIYIMTFEPKRERAFHYPYKHSFVCNYIVLDWQL
jgi:hypothetical protein